MSELIVENVAETCPMGGKDAVLRDSEGKIAECYVGPSGYMSGCLDQLHMYDCIRSSNNGSRFFCCPSKGTSKRNASLFFS